MNVYIMYKDNNFTLYPGRNMLLGEQIHVIFI